MLHRLVSRTTRFCSTPSRCCLQRVARLTTSQHHTHLVTQLVSKTDDRLLSITWDNGTTSRFPYVYLRDICCCPECFDLGSSKQRKFDSVAGLSNDLVASQADIHLNGKQITLTWPDSHVTSFSSDWLFERRLSEEGEQKMNMGSLISDKTIHLWDHQMSGDVPMLHFDEAIKSKSAQIRWLDMIHCYGIVLLKNAPKDPGQIHKLGEALGFLKEMWFGKSQLVTMDLGENEQNKTLIPQSSSPYDEYRGGLHLIHCQEQAKGPGGEHTFADGFNIAQHLQDNDPVAFNLLCTSPIMYQRRTANKDKQFDMMFSRPIIRLDSSGHLKSIVYNNTNRVTFSHATPDEIPNLYQSYYKLTNIIRDMQFSIKLKLQSGDIISYDCDRVLAGRNAYQPEVKGTEVFESGFTDKDMTLSRRRTIKTNLEAQVD